MKDSRAPRGCCGCGPHLAVVDCSGREGEAVIPGDDKVMFLPGGEGAEGGSIIQQTWITPQDLEQLLTQGGAEWVSG